MKPNNKLKLAKAKTILKILWGMKSWTFKYLFWRLDTAYPEGWKFILKHPIQSASDIKKYLVWCEKMDRLSNK